MTQQSAKKCSLSRQQNALAIQQVTGALGDFPREYQGQRTGTFGTEIKRTPSRGEIEFMPGRKALLDSELAALYGVSKSRTNLKPHIHEYLLPAGKLKSYLV